MFEGEAAGFVPPGGVSTGELVFNTSMSGYQEVLTDPSYSGQVVCFTYPHIGNYGVTPDDDEAARIWTRGFVVRDLPPRPSNWRASGTLESMLESRGVPGITGVDTRRVARQVRSKGRGRVRIRNGKPARARERQRPKSQGRRAWTS